MSIQPSVSLELDTPWTTIHGAKPANVKKHLKYGHNVLKENIKKKLLG